MQTVIYADILVVLNVILTYILLRACAAVARCDFKAKRFLLASALGGLFSLVIFVENIPAVLSFITKTAFLLLTVVAAFGLRDRKRFLRLCASYLLVNFGFAGIMLAGSVFFVPNLLLYQNGVVYFDIDILTLTFSALICYGIMKIIGYMTASKAPPECIFDLTLLYGEKQVHGKALYDTGNSLCDSFSGKPVIVARRSFLEGLFGKNFSCEELKGYRIIPYTTVKGTGMLEAFSAESVILEASFGTVKTENIYIGVANENNIAGGYCALIGTPVLDYAVTGKTKGERNNDNKRDFA